MPLLIIESGPSAGSRFDIGASALVGRVAPADIVLDNPTVSRRHALLRRSDQGCSVADLGSINGTFVDGRRVSKPTRVHDGTLLQFGAVRARYVDDQRAPASGPPDAFAEEAGRSYERQLSLPADLSSPGSAMVPDAPSSPAAAAALADRLKALDAVARFSYKVMDRDAILAYVAEQVFHLLPGADRVLVLARPTPADPLAPAVSRTKDGGPGLSRTSRSLVADVVGSRQGVIVVDVPAAAAGMSSSIDTLNIRSLVCAPIVFDDDVQGVIQADTARFEQRFERQDLTLLLALAGQTGMALAYANLHADLLQRQSVEHDLDFAKRLQHHFLPQQLPSIQGYDCAVHFRVAEKLGGDIYDVLPVVDGTVATVVGDVCGKGIAAALYAAKLGADLRYQAVGQRRPQDVLTRLNAAFTQYDHEGMFVTVAVALVDVGTHRLAVGNAGHPVPLIRRRNGDVTKVGPSGEVPLGVDDHARFTGTDARLDPGDLVVLYSDGITEAMNAAMEIYGEERLAAVLTRASGPAARVIETIMADVEAFVGGAPQSDDQTILCVKRAE